MFRGVFAIFVFTFLAGKWNLRPGILKFSIPSIGTNGLQCNQCSNAQGSANNCDSPVVVNCSLANSIQTQSPLASIYNMTINPETTNFQCMSLNTTMNVSGQNLSYTMEGCIPASFDICSLSAFSFEKENRTSCSTCNSDNCNNFNENNDGNTSSGDVTQCYQCNGDEDCQDPKLQTCDYNSALATTQQIMSSYSFDIATFLKNPPSTYACYSGNVSFDINGQPNIWQPLIYKGCIFEGISPCSLDVAMNQLTPHVSSCYTCDSESCNQGSSPSGDEGKCYVCNSYPCLDEEAVQCDEDQVSDTFDILKSYYSNVPDQINSTSQFECLSLKSKYTVSGLWINF